MAPTKAITETRAMTLPRLWFPPRKGRSTNLSVSHASTIASTTAAIRISRLGISLCTILANDSSGQCHRYSGKLMSPVNTASLLDSSKRLRRDCGPAAIKRTAPATGASAYQPGKASDLWTKNIAQTIKVSPSTPATSLSSDRGRVRPLAALP